MVFFIMAGSWVCLPGGANGFVSFIEETALSKIKIGKFAPGKMDC